MTKVWAARVKLCYSLLRSVNAPDTLALWLYFRLAAPAAPVPMPRRLRLIFTLLASCLLGSYGLQAYWLCGSYQVATAQFTRTATAALEAVLQRRQLGRVTKTFNIKFNDYAKA
jgi:hypothetical protein